MPRPLLLIALALSGLSCPWMRDTLTAACAPFVPSYTVFPDLCSSVVVNKDNVYLLQQLPIL